jgi:hypothetical protein
MKRPIIALFVFTLSAAALRAETPQEIFDQRIAPIFKSPNPSSCVQCHLASVDLKNYILPSATDTFLSLRDQGLLDLDNIEKSRILGLIQMGKEERATKAKIHQENRKREYEAFVAWLKASAADPALRNAPKVKPEAQAKPPAPVEVIRHARKDRVLESFTNNVWSMRFRCMSCHTEGTPQNTKLEKEHGERVSWFKKGGPEETLDYLMKSKLIDVKEPENSLLLLKPLNQVKHGGGIKFEKGDQGYKAMRSFLEDYARIMAEGYRTADVLPKSSSVAQFGTERWIKIANTPPAWGDKVLQVNVYAWDEKAKAFEKDPIATTDRKVWAQGKTFQHTLNLLAAKGSDRAKSFEKRAALERGRYLVKVYFDSTGRFANDWKAVLGDADFAGQVEVTSDWREGYGAMTVVDASRVKK